MTTRHEKAAILIVEDEAKMRRLLELQLGEEGFVVHSAATPKRGCNSWCAKSRTWW